MIHLRWILVSMVSLSVKPVGSSLIYNYCHMLFNDTYYTYSMFILHLQLLYSNVNNPIAFYLK